jgi:hypothetical protein
MNDYKSASFSVGDLVTFDIETWGNSLALLGELFRDHTAEWLSDPSDIEWFYSEIGMLIEIMQNPLHPADFWLSNVYIMIPGGRFGWTQMCYLRGI